MPADDLASTLAEIREREQAATKGPWEWDVIPALGDRPAVLLPDPDNDDRADLLFQADAPQATEADAEFIANARTDVPRLLAALEAALKEADNLSRKTVKGSPLERIRGECADRFRAAITTALTGKETGDGK